MTRRNLRFEKGFSGVVAIFRAFPLYVKKEFLDADGAMEVKRGISDKEYEKIKPYISNEEAEENFCSSII
jgi:hypothetical protein